jgi:lysophospholipase L1-like esterase
MEAKSHTLSPEASSTILFEGDSLTRFAGKPNLDTWPWMRMTGANYGYPEKVGDWIFCHRPDLNLSCRVGAVGGSVLSDVLARSPGLIEAFKPGIVVMTIGTNDATRSVPLPDFRAQAEEYCQRLRNACGGKVLYLGNLPPHLEDKPETVIRHEAVRPYSLTMAEAVHAHGGLAVDVGAVLKSKVASLTKLWPGHTIYHDGTHFNLVGNEIVAGVVLRALGLIVTPGDPDTPLQKIA